MAAEIRDYNPSTDADAVSAFYNRNHYGPARDAIPLTGSQLNVVLAERGVHLFLVAEDRGRIVGTIGYLRVSGRRVSRDDELFAGMFVIDPNHRMGFLAGRLFTTSFGRLLEDGITSLRVEANPANVAAFPLYVRVGFRSADPQPQPDQDGYIELVSHLPGVVSRLLRDLASDVPLGEVFRSFSWRTMAGGRNRSISHGVSTHDGEVMVEYDFTVRGDSIRVVVRMRDGGHVSTTINGAVAGVPGPAEFRVPETAPVEHRTVTVGEYTVEVDADGTVSVRHPAYFGAVYRDALASVAGAPSAWRRPLRHRPQITENNDGWTLDWRVDEARLQKTISINGSTLGTVVRGESNTGITAEPWSSIRGSVVQTCRANSEWFHSPNVPGLWPRDAVDFEGSQSAEPFDAPRRIVAEEPISGIRLGFDWHAAQFLRVEGQSLGRATTWGSELRYSVTLATATEGEARHGRDVPQELPDGVGWIPDTAVDDGPPLPAVEENWAVDENGAAEQNWAAEHRGGRPALVTRAGSSSELVIVPEQGIASWTVAGHDVLASPFPSSRTLGPLTKWAAGLWVCTQGGREDVEHGVGWGGSDLVEYSPSSDGAGPSWSIDVQGDSLSMLRLNLRGGNSPSADEIVAHLTPKVWGPTVLIPAHPSGWWTLDRTERRWFCFARAARIPLGDGRVLSITGRSASDELLIRSSASAFVVSLISRTVQALGADEPSSCGSSWLLSVETSEGSR